MTTDLSRAHHQVVRRILKHRLPKAQVRMFGSRASGHAKPWSDLDLAVQAEQPISDLALAQARADFEESDLPFRVDIILWQDLPPSMQETVRQQGKPI